MIIVLAFGEKNSKIHTKWNWGGGEGDPFLSIYFLELAVWSSRISYLYHLYDFLYLAIILADWRFG